MPWSDEEEFCSLVIERQFPESLSILGSAPTDGLRLQYLGAHYPSVEAFVSEIGGTAPLLRQLGKQRWVGREISMPETWPQLFRQIASGQSDISDWSDIKEKVDEGNVLHFAAEFGSVELVQNILEQLGADAVEFVLERNKDHWSPLELAIFNDCDVLKALVEVVSRRKNVWLHIANADSADNHLLHYAVRYGDQETVLEVCSLYGDLIGEKFFEKNQFEWSILQLAIRYNSSEVVLFILNEIIPEEMREKFVRAPVPNGMDNAFMLAAVYGSNEIVSALFPYVDTKKDQEMYEREILGWVLLHGTPIMLKQILTRLGPARAEQWLPTMLLGIPRFPFAGIPVGECSHKLTPIQYVVRSCSAETLGILLPYYSNIADALLEPNHDGASALEVALERQNGDMVAMVVGALGDRLVEALEQKNRFGNNLFHVAIAHREGMSAHWILKNLSERDPKQAEVFLRPKTSEKKMPLQVAIEFNDCIGVNAILMALGGQLKSEEKVWVAKGAEGKADGLVCSDIQLMLSLHYIYQYFVEKGVKADRHFKRWVNFQAIWSGFFSQSDVAESGTAASVTESSFSSASEMKILDKFPGVPYIEAVSLFGKKGLVDFRTQEYVNRLALLKTAFESASVSERQVVVFYFNEFLNAHPIVVDSKRVVNPDGTMHSITSDG